MMEARQAESGHAGRIDSLSVAMDLKALNVQGEGFFRIDERFQHPRIRWSPSHADVSEGQSNRSRFSPDEGLQQAGSKYDSYVARMTLLRNEALQDGYDLNHSSKTDFLQFIRSSPGIRKGNLVLMDNGNLRAIWKDSEGSRIGLQFLGGRMVQFVIFRRRTSGEPISRASGRDSVEGLERQIDAFELRYLVYE